MKKEGVIFLMACAATLALVMAENKNTFEPQVEKISEPETSEKPKGTQQSTAQSIHREPQSESKEPMKALPQKKQKKMQNKRLQKLRSHSHTKSLPQNRQIKAQRESCTNEGCPSTRGTHPPATMKQRRDNRFGVSSKTRVSMVAQNPPLKRKNKSKFNVSTEILTRSNTYEVGSLSHYAESVFSIEPTFNFAGGHQVSLTLAATQVHAPVEQASLDNSAIEYKAAPYKINHKFSLVSGLSGVIATNYLDKKEYSYQGSMGGKLSLVQKEKMLGLPLKLSYSAGYSRNFHEYTRSANDEANIMQSGSLGAGVVGLLSDSISLSFSGAMIYNETYGGSLKPIFSLGESISYSVGSEKTTSLTLGHYNKANTLKPDGRESNVALYEDRSSIFYGAVSHTF